MSFWGWITIIYAISIVIIIGQYQKKEFYVPYLIPKRKDADSLSEFVGAYIAAVVMLSILIAVAFVTAPIIASFYILLCVVPPLTNKSNVGKHKQASSN